MIKDREANNEIKTTRCGFDSMLLGNDRAATGLHATGGADFTLLISPPFSQRTAGTPSSNISLSAISGCSSF